MAKAYIFLAPGHEEIEALTVVDIARRAGIEIVTVSITDTYEVTSSHNVTTIADSLFEDNDYSDGDMLILPGGMPGTRNLEAHEGLMDLLDEYYDEEVEIAAICAAPTIFGHRGYLKGRKACCYPGMEGELTGANVEYNSVSVDGHVITSRGMGCAIDFALAIVARLSGSELSDKIASAIVYGDNR